MTLQGEGHAKGVQPHTQLTGGHSHCVGSNAPAAHSVQKMPHTAYKQAYAKAAADNTV